MKVFVPPSLPPTPSRKFRNFCTNSKRTDCSCSMSKRPRSIKTKNSLSAQKVSLFFVFPFHIAHHPVTESLPVPPLFGFGFSTPMLPVLPVPGYPGISYLHRLHQRRLDDILQMLIVCERGRGFRDGFGQTEKRLQQTGALISALREAGEIRKLKL